MCVGSNKTKGKKSNNELKKISGLEVKLVEIFKKEVKKRLVDVKENSN